MPVMNTSVYLLFLLAFVVICSGYEFTANLSAKAIKANDWSYKHLVASRFDLPGIWLGGSFIAGKFTGDLRAGAVDLSVASAYCFPGSFPAAYLAYFKANYNVSIFGQGFATADMSAATGYIGTSYLFLEERDTNTKLVATSSLQWVPNILTDKGFTYTLSEASQIQDDIQYVTFTGESNDEDTPNYEVELTYLASEVAGIIGGEGVKDVPVVPGSLESIVKIRNYPYKSASNYISLVIGVATGSATVSASGRTLSDPASEVYFSVSKSGYVQGNKVSLNVSSYVSGSFNDIDNDDLQGQVRGKYGGEAKVMLLRVPFPAGASNIVYDPSLGVGASVEENIANAAFFASPFLSLLLFAIAFALF